MGTLDETVRLFKDLNSLRTGLHGSHNIDKMDKMSSVLNEIFDTLTGHIRIAHAKDVKRSGDDKGEKHADIGDALESDVPRTKQFVDATLRGYGI